MPNLCEGCPIVTKIDFCCSSNPETGGTRAVRFRNSGQTTTVCNYLENDGTCGVYEERPPDCASYACEELYALGLGGQGE
jgi:hypothetical protein